MKVKVPYINLHTTNGVLASEMVAMLRQVINESSLILGPRLNFFEEAYASKFQTKYCVGVGNGLDALILCLKSLNIRSGDKVLVPSNTYIATWMAISAVGAIPVPIEPNDHSYNMDINLIESKIDPKTKAILPVHLYGLCADMVGIQKIATKYNLKIVEDNARAQGAKIENKFTGSFGHCNATSFYFGKNLGCLGDGGAVTTDDEALFARIQSLRNYGSTTKYINYEIGLNSRLDELQAAFLSIKLDYLTSYNQSRIKTAHLYHSMLKHINHLQLPVLKNDGSHVYHIYSIRTLHRDRIAVLFTKARYSNIDPLPYSSAFTKGLCFFGL